jgi:CYTH domain-containing protein
MEIERKWLVDAPSDASLNAPSQRIDQGYLAIEPDGNETRVRRKEDHYFLTVKSAGGLAREEYEIELSFEQFSALWPASEGRRVEKTRYAADGIELDFYTGALEGLIVAEVEFTSEQEAAAFTPPAWFGREVTEDRRYKNHSLAVHGLPTA